MKDQKNIILRSTLLFVLGIVIAYIVWYLMDMKESGWLVLLIFAPNIISFFYSGIVREFGYKDYKFVFGEAANEQVKGDFGTIAPSPDDMIQVGDQGIDLLEGMLADYSLSEEKPILMVIRIGEVYPRKITLGFIEKLSSYHSFKYVVFVDHENRLIAYIPAWAIRQRLSKSVLGDDFLAIVKNPGRRNELFNYPNVIRETIKPDSKRIEALQIMDRLNLSAIPVVDAKGSVQGVVDREKIISQMILKLAETSTK
jgi:CBS domain-containing protein